MKEWFITGADLCGIIVKAESFDEALAQARKINPKYSTGQVIGRFEKTCLICCGYSVL